MLSKKEIRAAVRLAFAGRSAAELSAASEVICHRVAALASRPGMTVLLYSALPDEVDTSALVEDLVRAGHTVLLPVVVGEDLELRAYGGAEDMRPGAFGILEPQGEAFADYPAIDLAVVPGRAFTTDGARLGRGRGYYDRLLPLLRCPLVGVCYSWQIVPSIPMDAHDIYMNEVIWDNMQEK